MAKKSSDDDMVQSTIRLPRRALFDKLKNAAKASGARGVSEEIRRRLEASFQQQAFDKLIDSFDEKNPERYGLMWMQQTVTNYFGDWKQDRFAFEVLTAAVDRWLHHFEPKGEAKPNPTPEGVTFFGAEPTVEKISLALLYMWLGRHELEQNYRKHEQQRGLGSDKAKED